MRRRRLVVAAGGATLIAVSFGLQLLDDPSGTTELGADTAPATVPVVTRDLIEREELDGTLGYGDSSDVTLHAQGTLTALPAPGAIVERGGVIAEVDGRPIRLLYGTRPLWRQLDGGATDGPDIRQLEENLVALGHARPANLAVDDDWTDATTAAVKRWQKAVGVDQTGVVTPADVVVLPGAARVSERKAAVGAPSSGAVLSVTTTEQLVTVDLDATRRDLLAAGTTVVVELPDGRHVGGAVATIAATVEVPADESKGDKPTIAVTISLTEDAGGSFDHAPVDVIVTTARAEAALSVPVEALLALAEGGYAVEKIVSGRPTLVKVEPGAFADGYVQVTGDLEEGDHVVVPR